MHRARDVQDEAPALGGLELGATEHPARLGGERGMHADDVGPMQQLRQPDQLRPELGRLVLGEVRIAGDDAHLEPGGAPGHRLADLAEADEPQRLAAQLATGVAAPLPLARTDRCVGSRHMAQEGQHERHGVLPRRRSYCRSER